MSKKDFILEVKSIQSSNIKVLFEVLKEVLLTDINLIFTPNSIKVIEKEGTERAMVHLNLDSEAFERYYCEEEQIVVGINTTNFYKVIKINTSKDIISFYIERNKPNHFCVKIENSEDPEFFVSVFKILNLEKNYVMEIPSVEFDSEIILPSSKFQKKMKNLNSLGIDCNIEIKSIGQQLICSCEGEFSNNKVVFGSSDNVKIEGNNCVGITQGIFPLKFLILFTKATSLCKIVNIYLKNDFPIILKYSVGNLGYLKFVLNNI